MKMPKTVFLSTKESEAKRLIQIAVYIENRFWQKKGFLLLPFDNKDQFTGREIYFPDLPYPKAFWDEAKRLSIIPFMDLSQVDNKAIGQTIPIILENLPSTTKCVTEWKKIEKDFWKICSQMFPKIVANLQNLTVYVTRYQRLSSFDAPDTDKPYPLKIYVHYDEDVSSLAEAVLSAFFRADNLNDGFTWEESESFTDNILLHTKLKGLFPNFRSTLSGMRSIGNHKFTNISKEYFAKLGYRNEPVFAVCEGQLMMGNKPLVNNITRTEYEVLKELVINHGQILSFEQIGNILWGEQCLDKYSEYAITKTIQRLREKISSLGITPEVIQTKRGQGYFLL